MPESAIECGVRAAARFASQLIAWFSEKKRDLPWRRTRDPYAIWVSEIMLQQTQVKTVIPYWERWMRELPTVAALAGAKEERVLKLWEGLGYYSRARNLQKAARMIVEKGGVFPRTHEEILELPGVGRYTAGAIGSIAFGLATPIVDGNVARVLTRYLGIFGNPKSRATSEALWEAAGKLVRAAEARGDLNEGMMELGATVCLPSNPECGRCPVRMKCFAFKNGAVERLPEMAARVAAKRKVERVAVVVKGGKILLRKRADGVVNAGFWELPAVEESEGLKRLCDVKHTIMNYRITTELFAIEGGKWSRCKLFNISDLSRVPLVSAHRKGLVKAGYLKSLV